MTAFPSKDRDWFCFRPLGCLAEEKCFEASGAFIVQGSKPGRFQVQGSDASVNGDGNGCEYLRPALQVLSPWQEHRIEEDRSILTGRLDRHHIQNPIFSSKAEIKPVQDQNQGASGQAQSPRSRYELSLGSTKTPTQALTGKAVGWGKTLQCASVQQHCLENSTSARAEACGLAVSCEFSMFACTDCTDNVESRSDKPWLRNSGISRATNACTRTRHKLRVKVSKNTDKFRLAFNQIVLSVPNVQGVQNVRAVRILRVRNLLIRITDRRARNLAVRELWQDLLRRKRELLAV